MLTDGCHLLVLYYKMQPEHVIFLVFILIAHYVRGNQHMINQQASANNSLVQSCICVLKCTLGLDRVKVYGNPLSHTETCTKTGRS